MSTYFLGMEFYHRNVKGQLSVGSIAYIYLTSSGKKLPAGDAKDMPILGRDCCSEEEFDEQIDRLKQELEILRTEGHRKFDAARR